MKRVISLLLAIPIAGCTPAVAADSQAGWSEERTCYRSEYREEYVPGTENNPGYVKSFKETVDKSISLYLFLVSKVDSTSIEASLFEHVGVLSSAAKIPLPFATIFFAISSNVIGEYLF